MSDSERRDGVFSEAVNATLVGSPLLSNLSQQYGTSDMVRAAKQTSGVERLLALTLSAEQALLSAEGDSVVVQLSVSTVENETMAMEAYRLEAEALYSAAENAKINTGDNSTAQAQHSALVASATATKSLALKQHTPSTERVKSVTSSAREAAEKVRLAYLRAAEATLDTRSSVKLILDETEEETTADFVRRVDACAERILSLHNSTQQNLRIISQRCSQALAARTQGDTAVMRTVRASKDAVRKPMRSRNVTENFQSVSPQSALGSRAGASQAGEERKKSPMPEFAMGRTTEVNRAARAAAALLRAQRNAARAKPTEPVAVKKVGEIAAEGQAGEAEIVTLPMEQPTFVEDLSSKTDSSKSSVADDACVNAGIDEPNSETKISDLHVDFELSLFSHVAQDSKENSEVTGDVLVPEHASCEQPFPGVIDPKEVLIEEVSAISLICESLLASPRVEFVEEKAEFLAQVSDMKTEREQAVLEHTPPIIAESEFPPRVLFSLEINALDLLQILPAFDAAAAATCVQDEQESLDHPRDNTLEQWSVLTEKNSSPTAPLVAAEQEISAALQAIILAVEVKDTEVAMLAIAQDPPDEMSSCQGNLVPAEECVVMSAEEPEAAQEDSQQQQETSSWPQDMATDNDMLETPVHDSDRVLTAIQTISTVNALEEGQSPGAAQECSCVAESNVPQEDIDVLLEVARLAEEEVEQWLVTTEKLVLSAGDILVSAEGAVRAADEACALAETDLHLLTEYRTSAGNAFAAVRDALHATSKEARLCEEDFQTLQLQIQTADDALMAEHTSIEEELSLLSKPVLLDDSDAARRMLAMENASMLQKIADKMESMLTAECKREEIAREHVKYVHDRPSATAASAQAAFANEQAAAVSHTKNSLAVIESAGKLGPLAQEALEKTRTAARGVSDVQVELRDALANADLAMETFKEACALLGEGVKVYHATDVAVPDYQGDALTLLTRHTQRRLESIQSMEETVEKVQVLAKHAEQLARSVDTACEETLAAKKEGDALAMRCVMSAAKASALASDARETEAKMVASAKTALQRAQRYVKTSRQMFEKSRASAAEAEGARSATKVISADWQSLHHRQENVSQHKDDFELHRRAGHWQREEACVHTGTPTLGKTRESSHVSPQLSPGFSLPRPHSTRVASASSPLDSAHTPSLPSPPRSAHRRTVSSPPYSARSTSMPSSPPFARTPSGSLSLHPARMFDVHEASSPLSVHNSSENWTKPTAEVEKVEALRRSVREAAARAEEWTLSAERIAHALHQTVQTAHIASESALEAARFVSMECASAKKCLAQVEKFNATAFDGFYAASVALNACEESKRALVKRVNLADGLFEDKRASIDEEIYLLEQTSTPQDIGTRRAKLMSQVHSAVIRREKQAVEHVSAAHSSTNADTAQKHAERAAFCASEVVRLQQYEHNSEQSTRARHSSANAAEQASAAAQEAVQSNHKVRVALEEARKANECVLHAAMDLQFWEAECNKLGAHYSRGELQELNNMPWFMQRCGEAARQVEEMTLRLAILRAQTQDAAAQVVEQSEQIRSIRSETELSVSRVLDASREASEVAARVRQVESEMITEAEAARVRARNEAGAIHDTVRESDPYRSSMLPTLGEPRHANESADPQTSTMRQATNPKDEDQFPSVADDHADIAARLREQEECCQAYLNRVQRADDAFTAVRVSIEKDLAGLKENERAAEAHWRSENVSESLQDAQRASFAQQRAGLQARLAAAATIREDKIRDVFAQAQEQQLGLHDHETAITSGLGVVMDLTNRHNSQHGSAADIDRVRKMEVAMLATVEAALKRAQEASSSFKCIVSCY